MENSTITKERYVSSEIAKLLKEKGFDEGCTSYYMKRRSGIKIFHTREVLTNTDLNETYGNCEFGSLPTQQTVCDWLRTKDVLITYDLASFYSNELLVKVYRKDYDLNWCEATSIISEYLDEAINDAIEYSLKNLI